MAEIPWTEIDSTLLFALNHAHYPM